MNPVRKLGSAALTVTSEVGAMGLLFFRIARAVRKIRAAWHLTVEQMMKIGVGSLPLVFVTSVFTGGVAAVQAAYQFQDYVPMRYLGTVVGKSVVIELGPVLTALVVGGRVSASIAAELGTMRVTEQIDALETLAIDPIWFLGLPRLTAAIVMLPIVTIFADILAVMGGYGVARASLDISTQTFVEGLRLLFHVRDVLGGLIKAFVFGTIIAGMGCYFGFRCSGGAEGVGRATTHAVVASCLLILMSDYILASALFRILFG